MSSSKLWVQTLRGGELTLAGKRYWSPDCTVLKHNSWHEVQAIGDDWRWIEIRFQGEVIRASRLQDCGFLDAEGERALRERKKALQEAVRTQLAREAFESQDILERLGLHLRILPDLIDQALAQANALSEREAGQGLVGRASEPPEEEDGDEADRAPLPELVPIRASTSSEAGCPECGYCPSQSDEVRKSQPPHSSGVAGPVPPPQGGLTSEELPAPLSAKNHQTTCCLQCCCCLMARRAGAGRHCLSEVAK
ncbi:MAG: hypothetical protein IE933_03385 [Sphingomonadales bacterium]|nr:hypothetical protein [Sphingomonadales bacterium]MBD3772083.1 hypothetical protein [Paracoccaceae bacterium]